jgi:hypothetical protein
LGGGDEREECEVVEHCDWAFLVHGRLVPSFILNGGCVWLLGGLGWKCEVLYGLERMRAGGSD